MLSQAWPDHSLLYSWSWVASFSEQLRQSVGSVNEGVLYECAHSHNLRENSQSLVTKHTLKIS